jgi:hypothetical protein
VTGPGFTLEDWVSLLPEDHPARAQWESTKRRLASQRRAYEALVAFTAAEALAILVLLATLFLLA